MLLVKIVGVWVATGSDLGNITLVQALGLTTNLLGGRGRSTCRLCLTKSNGKGWDQDKDGWSLGSAERGRSGQRGGEGGPDQLGISLPDALPL